MPDLPHAPPGFAVVTGAGSGVGRAVALALIGRGWTVALIGRREQPLRETADASADPARAAVAPCDLAEADAVRRAFAALIESHGPPAALVHAAGTNVPGRRLDEMTDAAWRGVLSANLDGAYYAAQAVLPAMRAAGRGTVVLVNSLAGRRASALSGVAYSASKFGLTALAQSINAEENAAGVRATGVYPGDIDTPLLLKRPSVPPADARARMLAPDDVAACCLLAIDLPGRAVVEEVVVRPRT